MRASLVMSSVMLSLPASAAFSLRRPLFVGVGASAARSDFLHARDSRRFCRPRGFSMDPDADVCYKVVFLRHGESTWNAAGRYIGWTDVPLTPRGEGEARQAGQVLRSLGTKVDVVYTSYLKRAIKTAWLALEEMDQLYVPCAATWELNERMYGLAGRTEAEAVAEFGRARVDQWAASFDEAPPPVAEGGPTDPATDTRKYASLGHAPPRTESLKDTMARASGYWEGVVKPELAEVHRATGQPATAMVVSHANTIRALMAHIDGLMPESVWDFGVPRALPLAYQFDGDFRPLPSRDVAREVGMYARDALLPSAVSGRLILPEDVVEDYRARMPANS